VNMLKPYKKKALVLDQGVHPMLTVALETSLENDMAGVKLKNSSVIATLKSKMQHLSASR